MLWAAVAGAGTKPGDVWLRRGQEPPAELEERFRQAVERRAGGLPFAYAVGRVGFRRLELQLDRRGVLPRAENRGAGGPRPDWERPGVRVSLELGTGGAGGG